MEFLIADQGNIRLPRDTGSLRSTSVHVHLETQNGTNLFDDRLFVFFSFGYVVLRFTLVFPLECIIDAFALCLASIYFII